MPETCTNARSIENALFRVSQSSRFSGMSRACLLTTRDRDHAISQIKKAAAASQQALYHFTVAGRRQFNSSTLSWDMISHDNTSAPDLLRKAQDTRGGGVFIFEDCMAFLRDEGGDQRMRMELAMMISSETSGPACVLIFLEPPESARWLPSILADQFVRLSGTYPRIEELEGIVREEVALAAHKNRKPMDISRIKKESVRLSGGLVGLTRSAARDALRDALSPNPEDFDVAFRDLQQQKAGHLRRELAMNVLETENVEEPIGLDYLYDYIRIIQPKIQIPGSGRARGILLIGPPGTGKTLLARTVGRQVNLPVVEFRISSLMNSLLGETERRFSQAFETLQAMAPNVVFIDEIEKAFGDSSERDGGTMMRCTGALLSWLSDNTFPNFILATSNSLSRMGEIGLTMTRSERFDTLFFVDVPSAESRRLMLHRWLSGKLDGIDELAPKLADMTEKFSGADIRSVVKQASARAETGQHKNLSIALLESEIERKRMRAIALYDEFQELRRWGRTFCEPAGPTDR
jgi:hypothetical protein